MNHCDVFDYKVNTVYGAQKHLLERHTGIRGRKPTGNLVLAPLPLHTIQGTLHVVFFFCVVFVWFWYQDDGGLVK